MHLVRFWAAKDLYNVELFSGIGAIAHAFGSLVRKYIRPNIVSIVVPLTNIFLDISTYIYIHPN